jgi:hypothetical protein
MQQLNTRTASAKQTKHERQLVAAAEWHSRLVDRLETYPPSGTTVASWRHWHMQAQQSTHVLIDRLRAAGSPWSDCIPNLERLSGYLDAAIADLGRHDMRRQIPGQ